MTMIYFGKCTPSSTSATTSQAGYPSDNMLTQSVNRSWRATSGALTVVTLTFNQPLTLTAMLLQDVNFAQASVQMSADGTTFTSLGLISPSQDKKIASRRRALVLLNATVQVIKITISAGTPRDFAIGWRIGAVHLFNSSTSFPSAPNYGVTVKAKRPLITNEPSNGNRAIASSGAQWNELRLPFVPQATETFSAIVDMLQADVCAIDFQLSTLPGMIYPVIQKEAEMDESFDDYGRSKITLVLTEVV